MKSDSSRFRILAAAGQLRAVEAGKKEICVGFAPYLLETMNLTSKRVIIALCGTYTCALDFAERSFH
jgi:hypothetical protein